MVTYTCMYTRGQKGIKMKMETIVGFYDKGNKIIFWHFFCVGLCLVLSDNYRYMRCHHRNMLHQISISQIDNDNVRQGTKTIFNDDNIHSSSCVTREKVRNFSLCM